MKAYFKISEGSKNVVSLFVEDDLHCEVDRIKYENLLYLKKEVLSRIEESIDYELKQLTLNGLRNSK
jgi:hypothetical protein